jgi:hypothetical protein
VFDNISLLWSLQLLPLWHQPPKRKTLKAYRKQIRLALIKDLSMIPLEAIKNITSAVVEVHQIRIFIAHHRNASTSREIADAPVMDLRLVGF